jgi:hypothetical protein
MPLEGLALATGSPMVKPASTKGEPMLGLASELTASEEDGAGSPSKGSGAL